MVTGSSPASRVKLPIGLPASSDPVIEGKRENVADIL
jgi:hypothetical protein